VRKRGITIIELSPDRGPAGIYTFGSFQELENPAHNPTVALLLHVGTTSRPKIVPLSHRNLAASAQYRGTLALWPEDRCLASCLSYIHGLMVHSFPCGPEQVCSAHGFNALKFILAHESMQVVHRRANHAWAILRAPTAIWKSSGNSDCA
jgi:acyl-CoA synthetase (AMP-forming)/AMP-acid ligase II